MRRRRILDAVGMVFVGVVLGAEGTPVGAQAVDDVVRLIDATTLRSHVAFLADDLLEGRAPGTRGGQLAARYIAAQFQRAGLEPVRASYFQRVPIRAWSLHAERSSLRFDAGNRRTALRHPDDIVPWSPAALPQVDLAAEIVFAGYGVRAPEHRWDDYEDADVRGKILLILVNDPPAPPSEPGLFDGPAMTRYGRWTYKLEEAERQGAAGALLIHTTATAGYSWSVVQNSWSAEQLSLASPGASALAGLTLAGWVRTESIRGLLRDAGHDLDGLVARAARRDFRPIPTGITMQAHIMGETRSFETANIAALLPGGHTAHRADVVIFTAHYDHLGIGSVVNGDSIYNGAYDNASGVAVLLTLAEAFARIDPPANRSILFLATTAEEAGLLGAAHYVRNPLFPLARTAAVINFDGANLWGETDDIGALGAERSTLGALVGARARGMGLRVVPERAPENGLFYRSDLLPFARAGVPAIGIEHGLAFRGRPHGWGDELLARYNARHYHQPSDRFDPAMDLRGALQQTKLALLVGLDIANAPALPQWLPGGEFKRPDPSPIPSPR